MNSNRGKIAIAVICLLLVAGGYVLTVRSRGEQTEDGKIVLRAWGVPGGPAKNVDEMARLRIVAAFQEDYPNIVPISFVLRRPRILTSMWLRSPHVPAPNSRAKWEP